MGDYVKGFWLNASQAMISTAAGGWRFIAIVFLQLRYI
jgi:hypothetical protein